MLTKTNIIKSIQHFRPQHFVKQITRVLIYGAYNTAIKFVAVLHAPYICSLLNILKFIYKGKLFEK